MAGTSPAGDDDFVLMGRIGAAHGIRGQVRIQSFCANPLDIATYGPLLTNKPDLTITIAKSRLTKDIVIATIKDVADREDAEKLNGVELYIPRENLPAPEEEDFYYADLIGLRAQLESGSSFGLITSVQDHGAGDLIEIKINTGGTEFFAFTKAIFPQVEVNDGYVIISPPDELEVHDE